VEYRDTVLSCTAVGKCAIQKKTCTHRCTCMHHDVHKQYNETMHSHASCTVESAKSIEVTRKPRFPDILASCLHYVTSVHWPGRHGRAKPSLHSCHAIAIAAACMGACNNMGLETYLLEHPAIIWCKPGLDQGKNPGFQNVRFST
jgi:hypothetical protein